MSDRRRGLKFWGAGTLVLVAAVGSSILLPTDLSGAALAGAVAVFYGGFCVAVSLCVRGSLIFLGRAGTETALIVAMATFGAVVLSALLHNVVSAVSGGEEPLFFLLALWVGPCVFIAAIIRAFRPYGGSDRFGAHRPSANAH
jgi:hypothetical protein